jgi:hypothetical protein
LALFCAAAQHTRRIRFRTALHVLPSKNPMEMAGQIAAADIMTGGRLPHVKQQIVDMALNGSGIRDTARVLGISKDTVLSKLKKKGGVLDLEATVRKLLMLWTFRRCISTSRTPPPIDNLTFRI